MRPRYVGVWIDHASARVINISENDDVSQTKIESGVESQHRTMGGQGVPLPGRIGGNRESHYQRRRNQQLDRYYDRVLESLHSNDRVLLMGPGEAKGELLARMKRAGKPQLPAVTTEPADRLTDAQILARVRALRQEEEEYA